MNRNLRLSEDSHEQYPALGPVEVEIYPFGSEGPQEAELRDQIAVREYFRDLNNIYQREILMLLKSNVGNALATAKFLFYGSHYFEKQVKITRERCLRFKVGTSHWAEPTYFMNEYANIVSSWKDRSKSIRGKTRSEEKMKKIDAADVSLTCIPLSKFNNKRQDLGSYK